MEGGPNVTKKKTQKKKSTKPKERKLSPKQKQWITEEGLLQVEGWARDGLTNEDISKNMGIHRATLQKWMNLFPDLSEALRMGKEPADRAIENSLYKRAHGYTEAVQKVKVLNDGTIVRYEEEVYFPPDTTAMIFWLKNRKPEDWRDQRNIELAGSTDKPVEINIGKIVDDN